LLGCLFLLQGAEYIYNSLSPNGKAPNFRLVPDAGAAFGTEEGIRPDTTSPAPYPINPNYLNDFRGYVLGMSAKQIDRLLVYRVSGNYLYSAREFQEVTGISDSLLAVLSPRLRFPARKRAVHKAREKVGRPNQLTDGARQGAVSLNTATAEELRIIRGIGPVLSERIVRFRNALGGFQKDTQLYDVYGLDPEVATRVLGRFHVVDPPSVEAININMATAGELAKNIYITSSVARKIVAYREQVGSIGSFDEISRLEGFPSEKIDRIKLYLSLK